MQSKKNHAFLVKSFTQNPLQGNPAGVILQADGLSLDTILQIAKKIACSESAFIQSSKVADVKVVFASPNRLVNLCGHGTIAAFYVLFRENKFSFSNHRSITATMETYEGDILKIVCHEDGLIEMYQKPPQISSQIFQVTELAALLHLNKEQLRVDIPIQIISLGTPKLLIPLHSADDLREIRPDLERIKRFCQTHDCLGFYPFYQASSQDFDFEARQFNPLMGIDEDPVTGIAAAALGVYARLHGLITKENLVIRQGYGMNRGGEIFVTLGNEVSIGGYATIAEEIKYEEW